MKKIIKVLAWLLLLIILLFNVYSFIVIRVLGNDLAVIGGKAMAEVVSGSMEPTIKVGDMIVIDTNVKDYKVNDIIMFRDVNDSFVTHRIIEKVDGGFVTQGDNNDSKDQDIVSKNNIVGKYCFRIAGLGIFLTALKNPITFVIVMLIGIIICALASTDKDGKPVDVDDEYLEFLDYKNKKKKDEKLSHESKKDDIIETSTPKEETSVKNRSTKSSTTKKSSAKSTSKTTSTTKKTSTKSTSTKKSSATKKEETPKKETTQKKTTTKKEESTKKTTTAKKDTPKKNSTSTKTASKKTSNTKKDLKSSSTPALKTTNSKSASQKKTTKKSGAKS